MPVQFRRDEEPPTSAPQRAVEEGRGLPEGFFTALRTALTWTVLAGALLVPALRALQRSIVAADKLLHGDGSHWTEMWMPAVLLAFFGAIIGAVIAWRASSAASIGGGGACLVGAASGLALGVIGALTAMVLFGGMPPLMCGISLSVMSIAVIAGAWGFTMYTH